MRMTDVSRALSTYQNLAPPKWQRVWENYDRVMNPAWQEDLHRTARQVSMAPDWQKDIGRSVHQVTMTPAWRKELMRTAEQLRLAPEWQTLAQRQMQQLISTPKWQRTMREAARLASTQGWERTMRDVARLTSVPEWQRLIRDIEKLTSTPSWEQALRDFERLAQRRPSSESAEPRTSEDFFAEDAAVDTPEHRVRSTKELRSLVFGLAMIGELTDLVAALSGFELPPDVVQARRFFFAAALYLLSRRDRDD